jgi:hypothetical protein
VLTSDGETVSIAEVEVCIRHYRGGISKRSYVTLDKMSEAHVIQVVNVEKLPQ